MSISTSEILAKVPEPWTGLARPFLQRAAEFDDKDPLVSYFLHTHVAFLCMKHRSKEDKAGTAFLMFLLERLEKEKVDLGDKLSDVDGRTILTRVALMLFARGDDAERTGQASMAVVRIFYTAAVLLEATSQFTPDGQMDAVAAQKCKYAKYIATRMKKALDSGVVYQSPNQLEEGGIVNGSEGDLPHDFMATPPASGGRAVATPPAPSAAVVSGPAPAYSPPPPPITSYGIKSPSSPAAPTSTYRQETALPPPQPPVEPPAYAYPPNGNSSQTATSTGLPSIAPANPPSQRGSRGGPSVDVMIDAQKYARQAVSALQFYDYENAKKQLAAALKLLNGC